MVKIREEISKWQSHVESLQTQMAEQREMLGTLSERLQDNPENRTLRADLTVLQEKAAATETSLTVALTELEQARRDLEALKTTLPNNPRQEGGDTRRIARARTAPRGENAENRTGSEGLEGNRRRPEFF